jgi:hypothetical protein
VVCWPFCKAASCPFYQMVCWLFHRMVYWSICLVFFLLSNDLLVILSAGFTVCLSEILSQLALTIKRNNAEQPTFPLKLLKAPKPLCKRKTNDKMLGGLLTIPSHGFCAFHRLICWLSVWLFLDAILSLYGWVAIFPGGLLPFLSGS